MSGSHVFSKGDRLRHSGRPEWGDGRVLDVQSLSVQGQAAQRLTVDFAHKGRTVLNTAYASLIPVAGNAAITGSRTAAHEAAPMANTDAHLDAQGWLASLSGKKPTDVLLQIPDPCTDPFSSWQRRLEASLDLYRYDRSPRGLLDWAIAQTGLHDPYSVFTRHDLEIAFDGFAHARDQHLIDLVRQIKRDGRHDALESGKKHSLPAARAALEKALRR